MKHISRLSKGPAVACIGDPEHPSLIESILGLLQDPIGVIEAHLMKDKE